MDLQIPRTLCSNFKKNRDLFLIALKSNRIFSNFLKKFISLMTNKKK